MEAKPANVTLKTTMVIYCLLLVVSSILNELSIFTLIIFRVTSLLNYIGDMHQELAKILRNWYASS